MKIKNLIASDCFSERVKVEINVQYTDISRISTLTRKDVNSQNNLINTLNELKLSKNQNSQEVVRIKNIPVESVLAKKNCKILRLPQIIKNI